METTTWGLGVLGFKGWDFRVCGLGIWGFGI